MKQAIYPGTFDPITKGHLDIIQRALKIFDKITISILENPKKKPMFSVNERKEMIEQSTQGLNVEIEIYDGLLVDYATEKGNLPVIRGLRAVSDFDFEFQMAVANRQLNKDIEMIFLMTDKEYFYLNSTILKDIAKHKGNVSHLVPKLVEQRLKEKFQ
ncbi:pantetheine-phosphate adenylyltransferase [Nanoarchaeota archaeon]